jgi:hypothetical protein
VRVLLTTIALLTLALAGCGDDGGGGGGGGGGGEQAPPAAEFIECFDLAGFEAVEPKPREESVLAFQAKQEGYDVQAVNVSNKGVLSPHAFMVFFKSADEARKAMDELNATSFGVVPPQRIGSVVLGYGDAENRTAVEPAIKKCL